MPPIAATMAKPEPATATRAGERSSVGDPSPRSSSAARRRSPATVSTRCSIAAWGCPSAERSLKNPSGDRSIPGTNGAAIHQLYAPRPARR